MTPLLLAARAMHYGGCWMVAGSLAFLLLVFRQPDNARCLRIMLRIAWTGLATVFCSGLLWLWIEAASMSGQSLPEALSWDVIGTVLTQTAFGHLWIIRLALVVALTINLGILRRTVRPASLRPLQTLAWLLATALLASLAEIGHAGAATPRTLALPADTLHLAASGVWPGALLPFFLFLILAKHSPELMLLLPAVTRRFSRISLGAVAILGLSGVCNSWVVLGRVSAFWETRYGVTLSIKLGLFTLMLVFAAINLLYVTPRLSSEEKNGGSLFTLLWRNVGAEVLLAAGVAGLVAALGVTPPPHLHHTPAAPPATATALSGHQGTLE